MRTLQSTETLILEKNADEYIARLKSPVLKKNIWKIVKKIRMLKNSYG